MIWIRFRWSEDTIHNADETLQVFMELRNV